MDWTKEKLDVLLNLYESYPVLWDVKCEDYEDNNLKKIAWQSIADELSCSTNDIGRKIHNLRSQFFRAFDEISKSTAENNQAPKWRLYDRLYRMWGGTDNVLSTNEDNGYKGEEETVVVIKGESGIDVKQRLGQDNKRIGVTHSASPMKIPAKIILKREINDISDIIGEAQKKIKIEYMSPNRQQVHRTTYSNNFKQTYLTNAENVDKFSMYGMYVANQLRKINDPEVLDSAMFGINRILLRVTKGLVQCHEGESCDNVQGPKKQKTLGFFPHFLKVPQQNLPDVNGPSHSN